MLIYPYCSSLYSCLKALAVVDEFYSKCHVLFGKTIINKMVNTKHHTILRNMNIIQIICDGWEALDWMEGIVFIACFGKVSLRSELVVQYLL